MEVNLERMEFVRGASTITQQLAKNLYLSPSKNPIRKVRELLITRRLEAELSKRRILELYLNVVEWGEGVYGAEAAARMVLQKVRAGSRPAGIRAARRCTRQRTAARSGTSNGTAPPPPGNDPSTPWRRDAAARRCRTGRSRFVDADCASGRDRRACGNAARRSATRAAGRSGPRTRGHPAPPESHLEQRRAAELPGVISAVTSMFGSP